MHFKFPLRPSLVLSDYLQVYYLLSKCWETVLLFLCCWFLVWDHCVREHTLCDFHSFKFVKFFYNPGYDLCGVCSLGAWKECLFCSCWVECSTNINLVLSVDGVFFLILLHPCHLVILSIVERSVEVSNCNCGFVDFSFQFYQLFTHFAVLLFGAYTCRIAVPSW